MTNLIDITDADLASLTGFMLTPAEVAEELQDAGIDARVEWAWKHMGAIKVGHIEIVVQKGRAFISYKSKMACGHGVERLPSHPLYPAPISNPTCAAIEAVLAEICD